MFEYLYLGSILAAIDKVPREALLGGAAYFIIKDVHTRNSRVKIAEINASVELKKLEVEELKLKLKLQETDTNTESA